MLTKELCYAEAIRHDRKRWQENVKVCFALVRASVFYYFIFRETNTSTLGQECDRRHWSETNTSTLGQECDRRQWSHRVLKDEQVRMKQNFVKPCDTAVWKRAFLRPFVKICGEATLCTK